MTIMRHLRLFAFLLLILIHRPEWASGQELSPQDFKVECMALRLPIDSILSHMPKPDYFDLDGTYKNYVGAFYLRGNYDSLLARLETWETLRKNLRYSDYITAEYQRLVIWYNKVSHLVKGFDILDSTFCTARGLRVGDPFEKLTSLYGDGRLIDDPSTDGPYDLSFHDYSQIWQYSLGDSHIAFFINGQRIRKIIVFFSLALTEDDWSIGFLKLGRPVDTMIARLGKPDSTVSGPRESTGFYFPKLVLWRDDTSSTLAAVDIYDSTYVTHRGLKVGSPSSDIERLYGDRGDVLPDFGRVGPYDWSFDAYDTSTVFDYGSRFFVVFSKAQRVVKILMYVGVEE